MITLPTCTQERWLQRMRHNFFCIAGAVAAGFSCGFIHGHWRNIRNRLRCGNSAQRQISWKGNFSLERRGCHTTSSVLLHRGCYCYCLILPVCLNDRWCDGGLHLLHCGHLSFAQSALVCKVQAVEIELVCHVSCKIQSLGMQSVWKSAKVLMSTRRALQVMTE